MNYYVDIIDTTDGSHTLIEEFASRSNVKLSWSGSDAKDDLQLVGSNLSFNMSAPNLSMGHFIHLFTGNETQYRVEVRKEIDDVLIWMGFLLPDTYKEPFTNNTPFINVAATDGIGRLKGKYLSDEFYTTEKSVIEVLQACLAQTSVILSLRFKAAIDHVSGVKWHQIYIDGNLLFDDDKKQNCHKILEELFKVHVVYQCLGYWYVEGVNVRHLATVVYDEYDVNGNFIGESEVGRVIKQIDNKMFERPLVTMVPAYKKVSVAYDIEKPKLSNTLVQEVNDGWSSSVYEYVFANAFFPHNGDSFSIASGYGGYKVRFIKDYSSVPDETQKMSLVEPVYVDVGQEVTVEMDFSISVNSVSEATEKTSVKIQIVLNGDLLHEILLYNDPDLDEEDRVLTYLNEAFLIAESGYLDVYIYRPVSDGRDNFVRDGWVLNTFDVSIVNQEENFFVEDEISEDYTLEKEVSLIYADEFSGLNKSFLLEKIRGVITEEYNQEITVYNEFVSNEKRYLQVDLKDANLCDSFKVLMVGSTEINVLDVVYNWLGSVNEHMVQVDAPIQGSSVYVKFQKKYSGGLDRSDWQSWTDTVYKIENERYGKIVANIYRRMFLVAHEKIDGTAKSLITFNDLIAFTYIDSRRYVPTNLTLDIDKGSTDLTMSLNYYDDNSGGVSTNISPILNVIDDFVISNDQEWIELTSTAFDPDGFIVEHYWRPIEGSVIVTNLNSPNVTIRVARMSSEFVFRCTVVDNDGATVSKDVKVTRQTSYSIEVDYSCGSISEDVVVPPYRSTTSDPRVIGDSYDKGVVLGFSDSVSTNFNFLVSLKIEVLLCSAMTMDDPLDVPCSTLHTVNNSGRGEPFVKDAGIKVFKNGLSIGDYPMFFPDNISVKYASFSMNASDDILIMIGGYKSESDYVNTKVTFESVTEINDSVVIDNEGLEFYLTTQYTLQ